MEGNRDGGKSTKMQKSLQPQTFEQLLVLDLEATCIKDMTIVPQEIIEICCQMIDVKSGKAVDTFHSIVRPEFKPKLSPFCIKLTGKM